MTKYHTDNWNHAMGQKKRLTPEQAAMVRKAVRIRRSLSNKQLSARFGVSVNTIYAYANGKHK